MLSNITLALPKFESLNVFLSNQANWPGLYLELRLQYQAPLLGQARNQDTFMGGGGGGALHKNRNQIINYGCGDYLDVRVRTPHWQKLYFTLNYLLHRS